MRFGGETTIGLQRQRGTGQWRMLLLLAETNGSRGVAASRAPRVGRPVGGL
jgi:hypothetical protein